MTASKACRKRRKKALSQAKPKWLSLSQRTVINQMTPAAPPGYSVDHIVPIMGITVSGLNVPWNLQYLPMKENSRKSNIWATDYLWPIEELKRLFGYDRKYLRLPVPKGVFRSARTKRKK